MAANSNIYVKPGAEIKVYHLVRPEVPAGGGGSGAGGQETAARAVPEVFLTRLLATKGTAGHGQRALEMFFFSTRKNKAAACLSRNYGALFCLCISSYACLCMNRFSLLAAAERWNRFLFKYIARRSQQLHVP